MIRMDLKRPSRPSLHTIVIGASSLGYMLQRALSEPQKTLVTLNITDEATGRTIFLRGRVK